MIKSTLLNRTMIALLFTSGIAMAQRPEEIKLGLQKPDANRFTPVVLSMDLDEPMVMEPRKNGKVYIAERKGGLKVYDPITETMKLITMFPVNTKYTSAAGVQREAEEGLIGFTMDPNYDNNHFVYLYYAHPSTTKHVLARWEMVNDKLVEGSEKVLFEVGTQREACCHTGGGMTWDKSGNLYLTVGNNTSNNQGMQSDERPGRTPWDDQRGSANTNDLRGKILRIHPEADGTYTIPQGNLFPVGTAKTRPEIYTMGHRNPWRPSIDSRTGFLYWGEVGPDAARDTELGTRGYDEFNQARKAGNFGWPYFVGENKSYPYFDYTTGKTSAPKDPNKPINNSVNNTGLNELPPAQPSFIGYPYAISEKYPELGSGGRSATGGPIFHAADFPNARRTFPAYYEGKWIAIDLARGITFAVTMDENSDFKSMERFLPDYHPAQPIDMKFGPDGDLYVLEYGTKSFQISNDSKLVKIEYNAGNRKPVVQVSTEKTGGSTPFKATLTSGGTMDYDGDALKYNWKITNDQSGAEIVSTQANPSVTLTNPGVYTATLTVTDAKGMSNSKSMKLTAGNEPPVVKLDVTGNKSFFFNNQTINYNASASDKEDGKIEQGKVAMSIDYTSEGFDYAEVMQSQRSVDLTAGSVIAQAIMAQSDCRTCHSMSTKTIGPGFTQIADKYKGDPTAVNKLAKKVVAGGTGVWGDAAMAAHPAMTVNDATLLVQYILNINNTTVGTLPLSGEYKTLVPDGDDGKGSFIIRAAYTDRGTATTPPVTSEKVITLHSPIVLVENADEKKGVELKIQRNSGENLILVAKHNGYIGFKNLDLSGIKRVDLEIVTSQMTREGNPGGSVEIRLDSPTGTMIGEVKVSPPVAAPAQAQARIGAEPLPKTEIKPVIGIHNVYFVFKNATAPTAPLMTVTSIQFKNEL